MDCAIYDWETSGPDRQQSDWRDRRSLLESHLKRAFPMIVDGRFLAIVRALDRPAG